jgi:hypothetical protein
MEKSILKAKNCVLSETRFSERHEKSTNTKEG